MICSVLLVCAVLLLAIVDFILRNLVEAIFEVLFVVLFLLLSSDFSPLTFLP